MRLTWSSTCNVHVHKADLLSEAIIPILPWIAFICNLLKRHFSDPKVLWLWSSALKKIQDSLKNKGWGTEAIALCNPYVLSVPQMLEPRLLLFTRFTLNISAIDTMKAWVPDRKSYRRCWTASSPGISFQAFSAQFCLWNKGIGMDDLYGPFKVSHFTLVMTPMDTG